MTGCIIGWTRQVPQVLKEIKEKGYYKVKEEYIRIKNDTISDYYLDLYKWYTQKSREYINIPEDAMYPIWFSLSEDFRLQNLKGTVTMKVEIPQEKALIIDIEKWEYRGNLMYVPTNAADRKEFELLMDKYRIYDETALAKAPTGNYYPLLRRKIVSSWERLFTMPPNISEKGYATAWEIKEEWIQEVVIHEGCE